MPLVRTIKKLKRSQKQSSGLSQNWKLYLQTAQSELSLWCTHFKSCLYSAFPVKILTSSARPPFCHCLQTTHHSRGVYHLANLPFHRSPLTLIFTHYTLPVLFTCCVVTDTRYLNSFTTSSLASTESFFLFFLQRIPPLPLPSAPYPYVICECQSWWRVLPNLCF